MRNGAILKFNIGLNWIYLTEFGENQFEIKLDGQINVDNHCYFTQSENYSQ